MKPPCYNRPPFDEGRWHDTGRRTDDGKPIYRWHWRWFADRCATWDGVQIGQDGERYPDANGWDCTGCRLDPRHIEFRTINDVFCMVETIPGTDYVKILHPSKEWVYWQ